MTSETLEKLKRLLGEANPGVWKLEEGRSVTEDNYSYATFHNAIRRYGDSFEVKQRLLSNGQRFADDTCELIVSAVNALPGLIACAEALEQIIQSCKHESGYTKIATIRCIAQEALAQMGDKETSGT